MSFILHFLLIHGNITESVQRIYLSLCKENPDPSPERVVRSDIHKMFLVQFYTASLVYVLGHSVVHIELLLICRCIKITVRKVTQLVTLPAMHRCQPSCDVTQFLLNFKYEQCQRACNNVMDVCGFCLTTINGEVCHGQIEHFEKLKTSNYSVIDLEELL